MAFLTSQKLLPFLWVVLMANRRMFSKTIVDSGRFLRMPSTTRLLYYDLGMAADDDGVVEAFSVLRATGATEDDLKVLAARKFVTVMNEDLVSYINDWHENNYIRPDRYTPTIHSELLVKVASSMPEVAANDNQMSTVGIPDDNHCRPQVRLGKGRAGKNKPKRALTVVENDGFDLFWKSYPRHVAKQNAVKAFSKLNPDPELLETILKDIETRKKTDQWQKDGGQYIPHPATYLNGKRWEDEITKVVPTFSSKPKETEPNWGDD